MRHNLALAIVSVVSTIVLMEMFARVVDPLGVYRYFDDLRILHEAAEPDPAGFTYPQGTIQLSNWSATFNEDGNRIVPDSPTRANCKIAFIGDSVTFGFGVSDAQTWVSLVAKTLPDIEFINTGKNGYNAGNFMPTVKATPADGYVYLAIENDADSPAVYVEPQRGFRLFPALQEYIWVFQVRTQSSFPATWNDFKQTYRAEARELLAMPNLVVFTLDDNRLNNTILSMRPDVIVIHRPQQVISVADPHPSAQGHREIAEQMIPALREMLPGLCN